MRLAAESSPQDDHALVRPPANDVQRTHDHWAGLAPLVLGGLITGIAMACLLVGLKGSIGEASSKAPELSTVRLVDIDSAVGSMRPDVAADAAAEAKSCKAPIAFLTVAASPTEPAGTLRIRSGAYISPPIAVGSAPQRVAIPFPAPYESGKGVIQLEGAVRDASIWLNPMWRVTLLGGALSINVTWTPHRNC